MKIIYIITRSDSIGGAQIHVKDMALGMIEQGHDVTVFAGGSEDSFYINELRKNGIPYRIIKNLVRQISPLTDLKCTFELKSAFADHSPDIVSIHSSKAGIVGRAACRLAGIPCLFTAHGWAFGEGVGWKKKLVYKYIEKSAQILCDKIITVSDHDREIGIKAGIRKEKMITVHNAMYEIPPEYISEPTSDRNRILMIARFEAQKNHMLLLHALGKLSGIPWEATFIGIGSIRDQFIKKAEELGILDRITFIDQTFDIKTYMKNSDIYALITNWEGLPRSIIEAMRAGLPVIASDVGGVSELVTSGVNGYLVTNDPEEVTSALEKLLTDKKERARLGASSREIYEKNFVFKRMFDQTNRVYNEILQNK